jgi:hypothetical protein
MAERQGIYVNAARSEVDAVYVNAARTPVEGVYVNAARTQVWPRSDPLTVSFYSDWTQGYMYSSGLQCAAILSGVAADDIPQGYWDVSQSSPAGTWSHVQSLIAFYDLLAYLDDRPIVKAATLRLGAKVCYGGAPQNTKAILGAANVGTTPYSDWNHTETWKGAQDTGEIYTAEGQVKNIVLNSAMRAHLQARRTGIAVHDINHYTSESGKRMTRAIFYGKSAVSSLEPYLTVTLDVV